MSGRSKKISIAEDVHLCKMYIHISEDIIIGNNQSSNRLWERIADKYNESKGKEWTWRSDRSLQSRWQIIEHAVRKLKACLNQIESRNPSGTNEQDRLIQAKMLFVEDPKYVTIGFKFDHVWHILKDLPKFNDNAPTKKQNWNFSANYISSESENPTPEYPTQDSPGLSSFNIQLSDDSTGGTSSKRPMGVKKAKLKKKNEEKITNIFNLWQDKNNQVMEMLQKANDDRLIQMEMQRQYLEMQKKRDDEKVLMVDVTTIQDPRARAYIMDKQEKILRERQAEHQQQPPPSSSTGGDFEFFNNLNGGGSHLPDY